MASMERCLHVDQSRLSWRVRFSILEVAFCLYKYRATPGPNMWPTCGLVRCPTNVVVSIIDSKSKCPCNRIRWVNFVNQRKNTAHVRVHIGLVPFRADHLSFTFVRRLSSLPLPQKYIQYSVLSSAIAFCSYTKPSQWLPSHPNIIALPLNTASTKTKLKLSFEPSPTTVTTSLNPWSSSRNASMTRYVHQSQHPFNGVQFWTWVSRPATSRALVWHIGIPGHALVVPILYALEHLVFCHSSTFSEIHLLFHTICG